MVFRWSNTVLIGVAFCLATQWGEAAQPEPRFAFTANSFNDTISQYIIDRKEGRLIPNGLAAASHFPSAVAVHPSNKYVFVTTQSNTELHVYSLGGSGRLQEIIGSPLQAQVASPFAITFDHSGRYVYVAGRVSGNIMGFSFDVNTAQLKPIPGMPVSAEQRTRQLAVHPSGKFLYAVNVYSDNVSAFKIDQSTGMLSKVPGSPFSVGFATMDMMIPMTDIPEGINQGPYNIEIHPSGDFLYVPNWMSASVSAFKINQTSGSLELVKGSPFKSDPHPYDVALSPDGRYLYSMHWAMNTIVSFAIDAKTGALKRLQKVGMNTLGTGPVDSWFDGPANTLYISHYYTHNIASYRYEPKNGSLTLSGSSPARWGPRSIATSYGDESVRLSSKMLYSVSSTDRSLFAYNIDSDSGALALVANTKLQGVPVGVAYDSVNNIVYVASTNPDELQAFTVTKENIFKPVIASPVKVAETPSSVAVGSNGYVVYVTSAAHDRLLVFERHPVTGEIKEWPESPRSTNSFPTAVKIDPAGRFAFVLNEKSSSISGYRNRDGLWPLIDATPMPSRLGKDDSEIIAMTTDPLGNFIYAADAKNDEILSYWINTNTGNLEPTINGIGFKVGRRPAAVVIHPNGKWAYVVNNLDNTISVFNVNNLYGNLIKNVQTLNTMAQPLDLKIDASGRFAYLRYHGSEKISLFTINETNGQLTHQRDFSFNGQVTDFVLDHWVN